MKEKAKLNKESLEKHFPRLNYDLSVVGYKSPIQVRVEQAAKALNLQVENKVYNLVQECEINVDKDELLKALRYDRNQYEKGFADGSRLEISKIKAEVAREIFGELESCFGILAFPVVTAVGTVVTERAKGLHISSEDYETIKKRYTEE